MKYNPLSRRMFLQGTAGAMAIPFLPSLLPKAHAAGTAPSKYVHIASNHCLPRELVTPLYKTPNAVPWVQKDADTKFQSLEAIKAMNGKLSTLLHEAWNPYVSKMNVITNTHSYLESVLHTSSIFSACSNGKGDHAGPLPGYFYSIDSLIEAAIAREGARPIPTMRINLAGADLGYVNTVCYTTEGGSEKKIAMLTSLQQIKQKLAGSVGNPPPEDPRVINRRKLVDSVMDEYKRLMGHRRISSVDKQRLGDAADLWNQFENRLGQAAVACSVPNLDTGDNGQDMQHKLGLDAVAIALSCGLTRNVIYTILQGGNSSPDGYTLHGWEHDLRDDFGNTTDIPYEDAMRWRGGKVTYLLGQLTALKDESGMPLLDSSLVAWVQEYASWGHEMLGHTMITAGGLNGRIETGWHVDAGGAPINKFYVTNMRAMGLSQADIEKNGKPGFGEYFARDEQTRDVDFGRPGPWRNYDTSRRDFFFKDEEKRRAYPFLKV